MYQSHFGLKALPFQLQPDPAFLFESRGYHYARQYLRFGLMQQMGFVVLTGEVGAGKTTMIQSFLAELDPKRVTAAVLVSTQLDADSLLVAIGQTFGLPLPSEEPEAVRSALLSHLDGLLTKGLRALLIIDEAQHLSVGALEALQELCDERRDGMGLLQCYLVGQPEMRELLQAAPLEVLRRRIIASCHLGPLDSTEVEPYISHRLRCAGWDGRPTFDDDAYAQIFAWTGGIPRRINLLCNRLLLAAFLDAFDRIGASQVWTVGLATYEETGGLLPPAETNLPMPVAEADPPSEIRPEPGEPAEQPAAPVQDVEEEGAALRASTAVESQEASVLMCVAEGADGRLVMQTLVASLRQHDEPPEPVLVADVRAALDPALVFADLAPPAEGRTLGLADWMSWIEDKFASRRVAAVLVCDTGNAALAAALAAQRGGIPVISVLAGERRGDWEDSVESDRAVIDRIAGLHLVSSEASVDVLRDEGVPEGGIEWIGDLRAEAARSVLSNLPETRPAAASAHAHGGRYALVSAHDERAWSSKERLVDLLANLRRLSRVIPLVLVEAASLHDACVRHGLSDALRGARITQLPAQPLAATLALVRAARCVLTDRPLLAAAAALCGVASVELRRQAGRRAVWSSPQRLGSHFGWLVTAVTDILDGPTASIPSPSRPGDGLAARRIAGVLADWLPSQPVGRHLDAPEVMG